MNFAFSGNKSRADESYIPEASRGKYSVASARRRREAVMADFIRDNNNKDGWVSPT